MLGGGEDQGLEFGELKGRIMLGTGRKQVNTWNYHLHTSLNTNMKGLMRFKKKNEITLRI